MVIAATPSYQLVTVSRKGPPPAWRFELIELGGDYHLEISEFEEGCCAERLGLWALIRGLEAIDRHARVQLVTSSRYVQQGISFGLDEWRANDWRWESFGRLVPIKHLELWQRIDRALQYHQLTSVELSPAFSPQGTHVRAAAAGGVATWPDRALHRSMSARSVRVHRLSIPPGVAIADRFGREKPMTAAAGVWQRVAASPRGFMPNVVAQLEPVV